MGSRGKVKREGKVIPFPGEKALISPVGLHGLAEHSGLRLDDLFDGLLRLTISGVAVPWPRRDDKGRLRYRWVLAENLSQALAYRRSIFKDSKPDQELFDVMKELQIELFGEPAPEGHKKD